MKGRAVTDAQKEAVMLRIMSAWRTPGVDQLRLGQFIENVIFEMKPGNIFNIEDEALAEACEAFAARRRK